MRFQRIQLRVIIHCKQNVLPLISRVGGPFCKLRTESFSKKQAQGKRLDRGYLTAFDKRQKMKTLQGRALK